MISLLKIAAPVRVSTDSNQRDRPGLHQLRKALVHRKGDIIRIERSNVRKGTCTTVILEMPNVRVAQRKQRRLKPAKLAS